MQDVIPAWVNGVLQPVEKLAVHQRALRHRAVLDFVVAGGRLLVQRRALGKYHTPGLWANTCCTHPHWAEDDMAGAQRRLHQELGITGLTLQPHQLCREPSRHRAALNDLQGIQLPRHS